MRRFGLTLRLLILLAALMVWQAKDAQAHEGIEHNGYEIASYGSHVSASHTAASEKQSAVNVSAPSEQQSRNCNGYCCHLGPCCSSVGLHSQAEIVFVFQRSVFVPIMHEQAIPEGPPYTLLRPPKISL